MKLTFAPLLIADPRIPDEARTALLAMEFAPSERHALVLRERAARALMAAFDLTCPEVTALL